MTMYLPTELKEFIYIFLKIENTIHLSDYISKKKNQFQWIHLILNINLDIVKFLHKNKTKNCTTDSMDYAAKYGNLEIIKFLHYNRCEGCTNWAMDLAVINGDLEIIIFLNQFRTEDCSTLAMDNASRNGHLDIVIFLNQFRTEGCTRFALDFAANIEVINWLYKFKPECC